MRLALSIILIAGALGTALAAEQWGRYINPRYGYGVDIPPGFSKVREAENGDGGTSRSADGQATLLVWGANLLVSSLSDDVGDRIESARLDGWNVTYTRVTDQRSSWSGERDGRIFYTRAILLCHDDEAGYVQIEYPAEQRETFDPIINRLVKGFRPTDCS